MQSIIILMLYILMALTRISNYINKISTTCILCGIYYLGLFNNMELNRMYDVRHETMGINAIGANVVITIVSIAAIIIHANIPRSIDATHCLTDDAN